MKNCLKKLIIYTIVACLGFSSVNISAFATNVVTELGEVLDDSELLEDGEELNNKGTWYEGEYLDERENLNEGESLDEGESLKEGESLDNGENLDEGEHLGDDENLNDADPEEEDELADAILQGELETGTIQWEYVAEIGCLTIKGTGVLPEFSAKEDVPWYSICDRIQSIVFETGITEISAKTFEDCINLKSVYIPDTVKVIQTSEEGNEPVVGCASDAVFYYQNAATVEAWPDYMNYFSQDAECRCLSGYSYEQYVFWSNVDRNTTLLTVPDEMFVEDAFWGFSQLEYLHYYCGDMTVREIGTPFMELPANCTILLSRDGEKALSSWDDWYYTKTWRQNNNCPMDNPYLRLVINPQQTYLDILYETKSIGEPVEGLQAKGFSYHEIKLTWEKKEGAVAYEIKRSTVLDERIPDMDFGSWGGELIETERYRLFDLPNVKNTTPLVTVPATENPFYVDNLSSINFENFINRAFVYLVVPVYADGRKGADGVMVKATVVDLASSEKLDDEYPVINQVEISPKVVYTPGVLNIDVTACDNEGLRAIYYDYGFGKVKKQLNLGPGEHKIHTSVLVPNKSQSTYGILRCVTLVDVSGNYITYSPYASDDAYQECFGEVYALDDYAYEARRDTPIEFKGVLSNPNVESQLEYMDEGKSVVLTIDTASNGIMRKSILDAIKGKDKNIIVYARDDGSIQWVFNGLDITNETKDLNLRVTLATDPGIEYGTTGKLLRVNFADNGELPGKVNFRLKSQYLNVIYDTSDSAYLYAINKNNDGVTLEDVTPVIAMDETTAWCYVDITHNSSYYITGDHLKAIRTHKKVTDKAVPATCTSKGKTEGSHCAYCGMVYKAQTAVAKIAHVQKTVITKATTKADGHLDYVCKGCGKTMAAAKTLYTPTTVSLSSASYTYSGKAKKPTVTVKDRKGNKIPSSQYTVAYKNNVKVGTATVTVTLNGSKYKGTLKRTYKINPKGTSISSLVSKSKSFLVKWFKQATQTSGYSIRYSTKSGMSGAKTVNITSSSNLSKLIKKLMGRKKYYVQVRTYKNVSGKKYYSGWSAKKNVTTKR